MMAAVESGGAVAEVENGGVVEAVESGRGGGAVSFYLTSLKASPLAKNRHLFHPLTGGGSGGDWWGNGSSGEWLGGGGGGAEIGRYII